MTRGPFDHLSDEEIVRLYDEGRISDSEIEQIIHARVSPRDLAIIDAFAYGLAKLMHTPINQLVAEADSQRRGPLVGSKAGTWSHQALDYAINTDGPYIATAYMKPPPDRIYDVRSRWVVYVMPSRRDLDAWYQSVIATPTIYHYVAAFDKTAPEWVAGRAVATIAEPSAYTSGLGQKLDSVDLASRSAVMRSKEQNMSHVGANHYYDGLTDLDAQRVAESQLLYSQQYLAESKEDPVAFWRRVRTNAIDMYQDQFTMFSTSPLNRNAALWGMRVCMAQIKLADRELAKLQSAPPQASGDYVGADGQSYPEVAARAVQNTQQQTPSPVYGYLRTGTQQKIYLYPTLEDAHGWFASLTTSQAQPYDYAAVFAATDLSRPVPGLESFGHTFVSGDPQVGSLLPFLLGLPAGAAAGYFLRRWQEENPGQAFPKLKLPVPNIPATPPKTSGDWIGGPWLDVEEPAYAIGGPWLDVEEPAYTIGGPWLDVEEPAYAIGGPWVDVEEPGYTIGGPWLDVVGAQANERAGKRAWPQTKALIQSAINDVANTASMAPAAAYVWSLDPPSQVQSHLDGAYDAADPSRRIILEGTSGIMPFASVEEALDYMRDRIQSPHVALALFDRRSPHWPNPTNWTKSNDPVYAPFIAQQIARAAPTRMAGNGGGVPWQTTIGSALDDVRTRAQTLANKRAGNVIGVIHTSKDGLWHALAFRNSDDADDWLGTATQDPATYTYAAYYDKQDFQWPHPVNEKIGGPRGSRAPTTMSGHGGRRRAA